MLIEQFYNLLMAKHKGWRRLLLVVVPSFIFCATWLLLPVLPLDQNFINYSFVNKFLASFLVFYFLGICWIFIEMLWIIFVWIREGFRNPI